MVLGTPWRCLVVLGGAGGAWWCMAVQCVWCVLFGDAWRCLVALGGAWWCLMVHSDLLRCLVVLGNARGAWWCLRCSARGWCCLVLLGAV